MSESSRAHTRSSALAPGFARSDLTSGHSKWVAEPEPNGWVADSSGAPVAPPLESVTGSEVTLDKPLASSGPRLHASAGGPPRGSVPDRRPVQTGPDQTGQRG